MKSCKQASKLTSKAQDQSLSWREQISLGMHLMMCKMCRRYKKQIRFINKASQKLTEGDKNIHLSEESRERIKKVLRTKN